ncbi:unnamed protein product [Eruca vesicaria subsp. sativa]|uniref:FBD domain-containing protein n=1 Tax=Eruca vesicaria subsp. sativa TaxID=29727 RepID=A0ABC8LSY2_ERUVS|nr:unnamed protein product [Eruca vesicaria subsp. sativa]
MPELVKASVSVASDQPDDMFLGCLASTQYLSLCSLTSQKHCVQHDTIDSWNQPSHVPESLTSHLETFEWRQYKGTEKEREREAAMYILANATFYSEKHEILKELECVAKEVQSSCTFIFE